MSRIKKQGLDYFPMSIDFMQNRLVRRIMKREGDAAVAVLLQTYCAIYAGEGYFLRADDLFYDDLADLLYNKEADDVKRIIALAVDYGLFDPRLYAEYRVLTSADIQRQFLFATRRRTACEVDSRYLLLTDEDLQKGAEKGKTVTDKPENGGKLPSEDTKHSTAQHSTAQHSTAYPLTEGSPDNGGAEGAATEAAEGESCRAGEGGEAHGAPETGGKPRRISDWTEADVAGMRPPADGLKRNLSGLLANLRLYRVPPAEQYAIVLKSNFGVIGHPVWKGFEPLRTSHGKIRQPGRYLLSLC